MPCRCPPPMTATKTTVIPSCLSPASFAQTRARDRMVEVKRDMIILTGEGRAAGRVAAVAIDRLDRQVTHILLSQRSQPPQYRLVPVALVMQVQGGQVVLDIFNEAVESLPIWHGARA